PLRGDRAGGRSAFPRVASGLTLGRSAESAATNSVITPEAPRHVKWLWSAKPASTDSSASGRAVQSSCFSAQSSRSLQTKAPTEKPVAARNDRQVDRVQHGSAGKLAQRGRSGELCAQLQLVIEALQIARAA